MSALRSPEQDALSHHGSAGDAESGVALLVRMLPGVSAVVVVDADGESKRRWPADVTTPLGLAALASRAATAGGSLFEPTPPRMAEPLPADVDGERASGAVAVEFGPEFEPAHQRRLAARLRAGAAWLALIVNRVPERRSAPVAESPTLPEFLRYASEPQPLPELCVTLAQAFCRLLDSDRVSVGVGTRGRVRVEAFSDSSRFDRRSRLLRTVAGCMAEAVAADTAVFVPLETDASPAPAHAELVADHGSVSVLTVQVPLAAGAVAAITCERHRSPLFDGDDAVRAEGMLQAFAPAIELRRRDARGPLRTLADGGRRALGRGRWTWLALVAAVVAGVVLTVVRTPHLVRADATVHGSSQVVLVAPFDSYLESAGARAGDRISAGDVLVTLQANELELARDALVREREDLDQQYRRAFSLLERADAQIIAERGAQVRARIARLDRQLERATLTAPFDGVVVAGNLDRALGAPVERGQVLLEVAPLTGYEVDLDVDERDIALVQPGQQGQLKLAALPGLAITVDIERVSPVSFLKEGRPVFRAVAELRDAPPELRPGMAGATRIDVGERALGWNLFRRLVEWLRLRLWYWQP